MAEETAGKAPIIVKKVKGGEHGHHGGAWKIAYADFVTAMMAFFLLLWLLNSVTQEQLEGISNYFAPVSVSQSTSGAGGILGGQTTSEDGAAQNTTSRDSVTVDLPPPKAGTGGEDNAETQAEGDGGTPDAETAAEVLQQREQQQFEEAKQQLEATLESIPQLKRMKESLLIDNTPNGLRIQLVDKDGLSMFPSGSSELFLHTQRLLEVAAEIIRTLPQNVSISGHTDAVPFGGGGDYGNWELSSDRANAARRWLEEIRVPPDRIDRVVGKADTEPLIPENPRDPSNRRLSIILLRGTGADNPAANLEEVTEEPSPVETDPIGADPNAPEALPGLNEIRRRQLDGGSGAAPAPAPAPTPARPALPSLELSIDPRFSQ